eukprot:13617983-Alexandrium_andersonii.AAC.1
MMNGLKALRNLGGRPWRALKALGDARANCAQGGPTGTLTPGELRWAEVPEVVPPEALVRADTERWRNKHAS